jgi:hypothetical protein
MKCLWLTLAVILIALPARAQDMGTPWAELGGNASVLVPILIEDGPFLVVGGGPRLGLPITRRLEIEALAEVLGPVEGSDATGFYLTQLKLRIGTSRPRPWWFTAGAGGGIAYTHFSEQRSPRLDGSTVVHPAYRRLRVQAPNTISAGVEWPRRLGRYASGSVALQVLVGPFSGFAVRAGAGMSLGLGRRR